MTDYVAYFRVSTDKQGITGLGMDAQREAVGRYVQNRGQIVSEFIEVESGRKDNRPQLSAALDECRKRRAVLLIARLDRLARNVAFIANLMNSDVKFVAVDMPQANRLTIHILAAVAEHEREMISQRTKAALAAAKARGIKLGNPRYQEALARARAALAYKPPPPEVLRLITDWRTQGDVLRRIASRLNGLNIRTQQGCQWYAATVRAALLRASADERKDAMAQALYENVALERNDAIALTSRLNGPQFPAIPSAMPSSTGREAIAEGTPMPSNLAEAERMLDLFTSVGARSFVVTKTDVEQKLIWGKTYPAAELRQKLPTMVRTSADRKPYYTSEGRIVSAGENLIVRPTGPDVAFVQLDDLSAEQLERVRPAAFLIIATSPGNHQAWIAISGVDKAEGKDFVRRVRKAVGDIDESASGATRMAGTANFKVKYFPDYPTVAILHGIPGRVMTAEQLQKMGLLAEPEPVTARPLRVSHSVPGRGWPDYERCVQGAPMNHAKDARDISRADFFFAMLAAQRGRGIEEIAARLMEMSAKAKENGEQYARITAENAAAAAARGRQRSRA
jgi:DNA invertase Pin-like site-specific DNA recombinase